MVFYHIYESIKQKRCVLGTAAGFGMELNGERGHILVVYALAGSVVTVHEAYFGVSGN